MYMDLTDMISGGTEEQQIPEQKLTKEEYAAKKQQEREEVWAEVDSQAQGVYYPPELGAQVFWLKNRKPDKWREKVENKIETEEDGVGVMILTPVKEAEDE